MQALQLHVMLPFRISIFGIVWMQSHTPPNKLTSSAMLPTATLSWNLRVENGMLKCAMTNSQLVKFFRISTDHSFAGRPYVKQAVLRRMERVWSIRQTTYKYDYHYHDIHHRRRHHHRYHQPRDANIIRLTMPYERKIPNVT